MDRNGGLDEGITMGAAAGQFFDKEHAAKNSRNTSDSHNPGGKVNRSMRPNRPRRKKKSAPASVGYGDAIKSGVAAVLSWYDPAIGRIRETHLDRKGLLRWVERYLGPINDEDDDMLLAEMRRKKRQRQILQTTRTIL